MSLENSIKDVITKKLEDGTVEKLVAEQLEKGVINALDNLFRSYGDVTKTIEEKVKSVMVPYLENYDYSNYITKLDSVLVEVLKGSALENKVLLENFKELMTPKEVGDVKVTDLFEKWKVYVSKNVDTDGLDINYDDEPTYNYVEVSYEVEYVGERDWLKREQALVVFECDHDKEMNIAIPVHRYTDINKKWSIDYKTPSDLESLRHLSEFEVFLMKITQTYTKLIIDSDFEDDEIEPEDRPEADFY